MLDVIISTVGRTSLERTLNSILDNRGFSPKEDRIYVVSDGILFEKFSPEIQKLIKDNKCIDFSVIGPTNDLGATQKTYGMMISSNPYVMFIDDDDIYTEDAFRIIKNIISQCPEQYYIFKMIYGSLMGKDKLWKTKEIAFKNVSTQMYIVHRENKYSLPPWGARWGQDFDFIDMYSKINKHKKCIWVDEIISIIRPII